MLEEFLATDSRVKPKKLYNLALLQTFSCSDGTKIKAHDE